MCKLVKLLPLAFCLVGIAFGQIATSGLSDGDEFIGPFPSWTNLKTAYGAVGDGVADDTAALQNALNALGVSGNSNVLYLPAGTYKITSQLTMTARQGLSIIGQDPSNTTIIWGGAIGGEMLYMNGVAYTKISRITWDGGGKALTAIDCSWSGTGGFGGSTYNEYSDLVFQNTGYGIRIGRFGFQDGDTPILRCKFLANTRAGVSVEGFNALDIYVWDSTFTGNYLGVTNTYSSGGGNFHVYGSSFQGSQLADIEIAASAFYSIRQNYSIGSNAFFVGQSVGSGSADVTFQSNTILDTVVSPITIYNPGTVLLFDNVIRGSASQTGSLVTVQDIYDSPQVPGDMVAIGNTVSQASWYTVPGAVVDLNNQVVARSSINPTAPTMPGALPNLNRPVFEVAAGSNAAGIQQAIDSAMARNGQRPVVHLPFGSYPVDHTLVIPNGSDMQLVGDGGGAAGSTFLQWAGTGAGPVLRLAGPSRAALRDFDVVGSTALSTVGIKIENVDQTGGRVFMEEMAAQRQGQSGLLVNGLDNAQVIVHDGYLQSDNVGIQVVGGPKAIAGQTTTARTDMFGALTADNNLTYNTTSHGRLMAQDAWYEGKEAQLVAQTDSGVFTLHGAHIAAQDPNHGGVQNTSLPTFQVDNFNGSVTLLAAQLASRNSVVVQGTGANTNVLGIGLLGPYDNNAWFTNTTSPAGQVALIASRQSTQSAGSVAAPDLVNVSSLNPFILQMVAQTRQEQAQNFGVLAAGLTDARFYRVSVDQGATGVDVEPGGPTSSTAAAISGIVVSAVTANSVTISWTTDQVADSQAYYGSSTSYGSSSTLDPSNVTSHSVTLTSLLSGTLYHFAVRSRSQSGYLAVSADMNFTTPVSSTAAKFITGFTPGSPVSNGGWVGMQFTVQTSVPEVTSLGRMCVAGNTGSHALKLVRVSNGVDVPGAGVTVSMTGCTAGTFIYGQLPAAVILSANTAYDLVSLEVSGGDAWLNTTPVTTTNIGVVNGAATIGFGLNPGAYVYGPLDFQYLVAAADATPPTVTMTAPAAAATVVGKSVLVTASASDNVGVAWVQFKLDGVNLGTQIFAAPYALNWDSTTVANGAHTLSAVASDAAGNTASSAAVSIAVNNASTGATALITGFSGNFLRNNYTGFVGMQFAVGSSDITVTALGRMYVAGNSQSHAVKLVQADGTDLSGGAVTIGLPSGQAGQYAYVNLPSAIVLHAGGTYYLVSQETSSGDQWYDYNFVSSTSAATVLAAVYDASYTHAPGAGESYVPLNLLYTWKVTAPPSVSITTPGSGVNVTGSLVVSAAATGNGGASIATVQFKLDGSTSLGTATASPYSITWNSASTANGSHILTAIATDSNGISTTSAGVPVTAVNSTPPTVTITSPSSGALLTGTTTLSASAAAQAGLSITSVQFQLDGSNLGSASTAFPYTLLLNTATLSNGSHIISAVASDSNGNSAASAGVTVTTSNVSAPVAFVTGQSLSALRNDSSGFKGMKFTVGAAPLTVYALGRIYVTGNLASHVVKLVADSTLLDVPGASVTVLGGTSNRYTYAQLAAPVTLAANSSYYLVSQESLGGDQWYDNVPISYTNAATVIGLEYGTSGADWHVYAVGSYSYVPVNMLYTVPTGNTPPVVTITAPAANATVSGKSVTVSATATPAAGLTIASVQFKVDGNNLGLATASPYAVTLDSTTLSNGIHSLTAVATDSSGNAGTAPAISITVSNSGGSSTVPLLTGYIPSGTLRNNFSSWVGLQFTVGTTPLTVTALGRVYLTGNTGTHALKLVTPGPGGSGTDVAGGSTTVTLPSGTAGQFVYGQLPAPLTLAAGSTYYLMSLEVSGGDTWYDWNTSVTPGTTLASIIAPVYLAGSYNTVNNSPNFSYVPVNLLYATSTPTAVSVAAPAVGASISGSSVGLAATVTPGLGLTITNVQFKVDGTNAGPVLTAPSSGNSYTASLDATKFLNGTHAITAVALDSGGNSVASAAVSVTVANAAPTVNVSSPANGATITGKTVALSAAATAGSGLTVTSVQFKVDGSVVAVGAAGAGNSYTATFDATVYANNSNHAITAVATDSAGNTATSSAVNVTVNNAGTAVSVTAPSSGAGVLGASVPLAATATPGGGLTIASVQFKVDGANVGPLLTAPSSGSSYTATLDATKLIDGAHTITAVTVDSANNSVLSAAVPITVVNATPTGTITSPANGATITGKTVALSTTATVGTGLTVASVQFKVDGSIVATGTGGAGTYTAVLDSTVYANNSTHSITALITDSAGNPGTPPAVNVTVNNGGGGGGSTSALISGFTANGASRNNFSSWVGLQFTVGATPLTVTALGRAYLAGNSGTHALKLVNPATGGDVAGGGTSVTLTSGTAGQFVYGQLAAPLTLAAGSSYYLVSQELSGGDAWYDWNTQVTPATALAAVTAPVYLSGLYYTIDHSPNFSYVPVNLLYATSSPTTVNVTAPSASASVSGTSVALAAAVTPGPGVTITNVQFKVDGTSVGPLLTTPSSGNSYTAAFDATKFSNGAHTITAVALDSGGNSVLSAGVAVTVANVVPTASVTSPANGATISGKSVALSATATVGAGLTVASVQFKVDGSLVASGTLGTGNTYTAAFDSTAYTNNSTHAITALVTDSAGNTAASMAVTVTVNNTGSAVIVTAPTAAANISGAAVTLAATATPGGGLTITSVQFKVDGTNVGALLTTPSSGSSYTTAFDATKFSNGTHVITAVALDSGNNSISSPVVSVTVANAAPTVSISSPANGATITGKTVALSASAIAGSGLTVASVQFKVDGAVAATGVLGTGSTYSAALDSTVYTNNSTHSISAVVTDSAGNTAASSAISVTVNNAGTSVSVTAPVTGANVSGVSVALAAAATPGGGLTIKSVQFKVDGTSVGALLTAPSSGNSYTATFDATKFSNGSHAITAVAIDSNNNSVPSSAVSVTVANAAPTVSISNPANGATITGKTVALSAAATPGAGLTVASVQFKVDGSVVAAGVPGTGSTYSATLDSTVYANNSTHAITALVTDSAGNTATSAAVTVTAANGGGGSSAALISGFSPGGATRNNFSSWVGLQFTVGSTPLTLTALGRVYLSGNNGVHALKLVNPSTGVDVPNSSTTVTLPSGTVGQFVYGQLAAPLTLAAGSTYYLLSQEVSGGDTWYDWNTQVTPGSSMVAVTGPVYLAGGTYYLIGGTPNNSYVPVNLLYTTSTATPTMVSVTAPAGSASVSGSNVALAATVIPGVGLTITNVQFKVDGANVGALLTAPSSGSSYTASFDASKFSNGVHSITALALDSGNNSVLSAPVSVTVANSATTVNVTAPTVGAISGPTVALAATAAAGTGLTIASVQFKVDGTNVGPLLTAPTSGNSYTAAFDSTAFSNGSHTITAVAIDSSSVSVTSPGIAVTVSNSGVTGTPLLSGYHPQAAQTRNNFTSMLGFEFTTGSTGVTITALGRIYLTGSTGAHTLKLVSAATGLDVPGGSATVTLSSSNTNGQFVYAALAAPLKLTAGASYYLVSQETSGGDQWWDWNTQVTPGGSAPVSVIGPVYALGGQYNVISGSPNYSYVPLNFLYQ